MKSVEDLLLKGNPYQNANFVEVTQEKIKQHSHLKHGFLNRLFLNESFKKCTFFLMNLALCKK